MARKKRRIIPTPQAGWAVYLRTSSDENQKPELSRARQRYAIEKNVLDRSDMPVYGEYIDVLTGTTPERDAYQRLLGDARQGKFSHVIVERADRFGRNDTEALRAIDELHEFGVAVRFANQPDLDPMDPDDRVIVALSFTLARRESALLGLRVQGGVHANRERGGYHGAAPDGYLNKSGIITGEAKKLNGRTERWIELDPERAPIWRYAWDLLLAGQMTLEEISEALHARGYRYRSGRPFVEIKPDGKRKCNINTLAAIFHNWTYAGWITSKTRNIPPKTLKGAWEPLVTTEELERGIAILDQRDLKRGRKRHHDYLLKGLVYFQHPEQGRLVKLTCSTSNSSRSGGGTSYYCIARSNINFLCSAIDCQIPHELQSILVDPDLIPQIRAVYTQDVAEKMGHLRPDERQVLENALKAVEEEEARMARLYATGKVSQAVWDSMWREWQDRRNRIHLTMESLQAKQEAHITNLDIALKIIAHVGIVYNTFDRSDQKELLHHMVERVIIDSEGTIRLELRTPFAYLRDISNAIRGDGAGCTSSTKAKTDSNHTIGLGCGSSDNFLSCGEDRIRTCGPVLPGQPLSRRSQSSTLGPPPMVRLNW